MTQCELLLTLDRESCVAPGLRWEKFNEGTFVQYQLFDRMTFTGWQVDHCGHPTALRPYAITDQNTKNAYATHNSFAFGHAYEARWSALEMYKAIHGIGLEDVDPRVRDLYQDRAIQRAISLDSFKEVPYKFRGSIEMHTYLGARLISNDEEKFTVDLVDTRKRGRKKVIETVEVEAKDRNDAKRIAEYEWVGGTEHLWDIREACLKEPIEDSEEMIATLKGLVAEGMDFPRAGYMKWEDKYTVSKDYTYFSPYGWKPQYLPRHQQIIVRRKK